MKQQSKDPFEAAFEEQEDDSPLDSPAVAEATSAAFGALEEDDPLLVPSLSSSSAPSAAAPKATAVTRKVLSFLLLLFHKVYFPLQKRKMRSENGWARPGCPRKASGFTSKDTLQSNMGGQRRSGEINKGKWVVSVLAIVILEKSNESNGN
ncbi:hypothetical protein COP2_036995 [Malus domestica]